VTERPARGHGRHVALEDVQVGTADGGGGDADDRVAVVDDLGVGDLFPALVSWSVEDDGRGLLPRGGVVSPTS